MALYLSFFFQLLPFYYSDNEELNKMAADRSILNRNKTIEDLNISLKQVK